MSYHFFYGTYLSTSQGCDDQFSGIYVRYIYST